MEARHDIAFAPYPFRIVGRCAVKRSIKERLAETPHIDDQFEAAFHGEVAQAPAPGARVDQDTLVRLTVAK